MSRDQEIYEELAGILIKWAPLDAKVVKFRFVVHPFDDGKDAGYYEYLFDYVNSSGEETWYSLKDDPAVDRLSMLSVELRKAIRGISGDLWHSMEFNVDLVEGKFKVNFDYNPPTSSGIK